MVRICLAAERLGHSVAASAPGSAAQKAAISRAAVGLHARVGCAGTTYLWQCFGPSADDMHYAHRVLLVFPVADQLPICIVECAGVLIAIAPYISRRSKLWQASSDGSTGQYAARISHEPSRYCTAFKAQMHIRIIQQIRFSVPRPTEKLSRPPDVLDRSEWRLSISASQNCLDSGGSAAARVGRHIPLLAGLL